MPKIAHVVNILRDNKPRKSADYPVLGVLCHRPAHGYDLCRALDEWLGGIWRLRTSHVYALLAGLEKDGLATHERVDQDPRPAKKVFSVTDEGRRVFLAWVRTPVMHVRDIRMEFLAKLHFARLDSPKAVEDLIANQLSVVRSTADRLMNSRRLCKTDTARAALDYRLAVVNAVRTWLLDLRESNGYWPRDEYGRPPASRADGASSLPRQETM